jgi:hypothetical protein
MGTKRYQKINSADRTRMAAERKEQLADLATEMGLWAVEERKVLNRDIERLTDQTRKVVFDTKDQIVRFVKAH